MIYPSNVLFEPTDDGIRVRYKRPLAEGIIPKFNLDVWGIGYLLNAGLYHDDRTNVVHLDVIDVTMALRLHFLSKADLFRNIQFEVYQSDEIRFKVEDILDNVGKTKKYVTYDKGSDFSIRGTGETLESKVEKNLCENISLLSGSEFPASAPLIRQFPPNIFERERSEATRVTRKLWIDILTVDKVNQLSVIELKVSDNIPLDLLIQAIDYGVFCHLFKQHISECWFRGIEGVSKNKIAIYCMAEKFHPAITGDKNYTGLTSLIQRNDFFDIILMQIEVENAKVVGTPQILFDTRTI